uniref:Uncharacterized protein n=1 Tax=Rhizophora mucronata TaxID=61149 RepID=A0A2P2PRI0_RHIMU
MTAWRYRSVNWNGQY